jgi:hypothetical protein
MKLFAFFLLFASISYAAEFGTFMLVKGKVLIVNDKGQPAEAKVSSKIFVGETVVTDADSRAKIIMSDRNVLNILPNTKMRIEKYNTAAGSKEVQLNLIEGKVRSNVGEKYDNKSSKFEIRTATAVAGVRGTEFITSYDPATKTTEVLTIHGQVIFKSVGGPAGTDAPEVTVNKQEKSEQKGNSSPSKPAKVPKSEFDAINKDTNVASDKKEKDGGGKGTAAGKDQAPDTAAPDDNKGGQLADDPNIGGTTIPALPVPEVKTPDKTKVNVIISPAPTPSP